MTEEKVIEMFKSGLDCGQVITCAVAKDLGIDEKTALKSAAAFGGGIFEADMCGAYIGGLIAVGLKYGHSEPNDGEGKAQLIRKVFEYKEKFSELENCSKGNGCRDILGYNLTVKEDAEKIEEKNLLFTVCPKLVVDIINIVNGL